MKYLKKRVPERLVLDEPNAVSAVSLEHLVGLHVKSAAGLDGLTQ